MQNAETWELMTYQRLKLAIVIGTAQTARLIAACAVVSDAALNVYKAVQCDGCEMWIHNECSFITEAI